MKIIKKLRNAIIQCSEIEYAPNLYVKILEKIGERYPSQLVKFYFIRVLKERLHEVETLRILGASAIYSTDNMIIAKKIRDLFHNSGFKNSRIIPIKGKYRVVCETPDNITLTSKFISKLQEGNEEYMKLLNRFLKELFLRNLKRLKLLLKNTKF